MEHKKNKLEQALLKTRVRCTPLQHRVASCFVLMRNRLCTSERGAGKRPLGPKRTTEQPDSFNGLTYELEG